MLDTPGELSSGEDPWSRPMERRKRRADGEAIRKKKNEKSEGAHSILPLNAIVTHSIIWLIANYYSAHSLSLYLHRFVKANYLVSMDEQASMGNDATINSYYFSTFTCFHLRPGLLCFFLT